MNSSSPVSEHLVIVNLCDGKMVPIKVGGERI